MPVERKERTVPAPRTCPCTASPETSRRAARRRWARRLIGAFAVPAAFLLGFVPPSYAQGTVNAVVAVNQSAPGRPVSRFGWDLRRATGEAATARNAAVAVAVGRGSRTVAMAWQILLISHVGDALRVLNTARSDGTDCAFCDTTAIAYQFVVASSDALDLAPWAEAALARLRARAAALDRSPAPGPVLTAWADAVAIEVHHVLAAGVLVRRDQRSGEPAAGTDVVVHRMVDRA
jgi:hypothetical protein